MAYQNVGTPRFYINVLEWLDSVNYINISNWFRTSPVDPKPYEQTAYDIPAILGTKSFVALLGHKLATDSNNYAMIGWGGGDGIGHIVNTTPESGGYDGFSISTFDGEGIENVNLDLGTWGTDIGSVVVGTYYDMPHSPDLSLTMTREFGGVKTIETKGGASLSNSFYTKPPMWGDAGSWELYQGTPTNQALSRSGRRIWDLSFSYLDDGDVFGSNQTLLKGSNSASAYGGEEVGANSTAYDAEDLQNDGNNFTYNILTDDNLYSLIHKTNGLPFIFQPNKDDNTTYSICKFDQNSFSFQQTAPNLYSVKMKIREVW